MEKIINKLIDECVVGVDTYSHNGSTWLIFTESKQWVIELTESKTLWYNYNFFKGMFAYTSMDVVENQHYITKWVEDNIIGGGAKETQFNFYEKQLKIEGVIKNGSIDSVRVNEYSLNYVSKQRDCEDTIENGVKETHRCSQISDRLLEDTIQNGVKNIMPGNPNHFGLEDTVQNGIKETRLEMNITEGEVDDIIQDGVKETNHVNVMGFFNNKMEDTLQNGVKETNYDTDNYTDDVNEVIREGVRTSHPRQYVGGDIVDKVIDKGVIETHREICEYKHTVDYIIQTGVKETHEDAYHHKGRIDGVINNGVKEIYDYKGFRPRNIDDIIQTGIKETKTPGNGDLVSTVEWMNKNNSSSYTKMIDDVIDNGVKETKSINEWVNTKNIVGKVIDNGVKKTMLRQHITDGNVETIIETGIKEVQPLPDQSGELIGYGNYYHGKEDRTKAFIDYIEETIKFGVKENIG